MDSLSARLPTLAPRLLARRSALRTICTSSCERSWILQYTEKRMMPTKTKMFTVNKVLIFRATAMGAAGAVAGGASRRGERRPRGQRSRERSRGERSEWEPSEDNGNGAGGAEITRTEITGTER